MSMKVLIYGDNEEGIFRHWTRSLSVSAHGGVMRLDAPLNVGQTFQMVNEHNGKKATGKVVSVRKTREGLVHVSFEFVESGEKFWSMTFPAAGAKPLRRLMPRVAEGN
jgi:hypothetical protein